MPRSKRPAKKDPSPRKGGRAVATAFPHAQVELWGMGATDEQRIGLKPLRRRVWAPIGQRPIATVQQRFAWRYLVGFVHPASGRTIFHLAHLPTTVSIPVFEVELEHLWPLTNSVLVNRHFVTIEELEDAQFARCAELQRHPEQIRSTTRFHWWPQRIKKRQGPRLR